ncbi:MAG: molybdopterin-binding protein [Propionibacteriaceae bacterium]|nr:molybdopterin-binding protein [Propionibacteriaceae bacterium]
MPVTPVTAAVIVVSNEIAAGSDENRAGPVAVEELARHDVRAEASVVADDAAAIAGAVHAAAEAGHRVILTCGGTGIGPTDVTVDAVRPLLAAELPGVGEEIRRRGLVATPLALVSREVAGVLARDAGPSALVVCAPGSRGGVRDAIAVVGPLIRYLLGQLDGRPRA